MESFVDLRLPFLLRIELVGALLLVLDVSRAAGVGGVGLCTALVLSSKSRPRRGPGAFLALRRRSGSRPRSLWVPVRSGPAGSGGALAPGVRGDGSGWFESHVSESTRSARGVVTLSLRASVELVFRDTSPVAWG